MVKQYNTFFFFPQSSLDYDCQYFFFIHPILGHINLLNLDFIIFTNKTKHKILVWYTSIFLVVFKWNDCIFINVFCFSRDLNPENILVCGGTLRLTYFCSFPSVEPTIDMLALKRLYCAPEINSIFPVTFAADWWSYGVILYHLLTGQVSKFRLKLNISPCIQVFTVFT